MTSRFGEHTLDEERRQLLRRGEPVHLSPKAFELLRLLVASRPRVLSKAEIFDGVWKATFVSDANLARVVTEVRAAVEDDARDPHLVRTVHGFGYAFIGSVDEDAPAAADARPTFWLVWSAREVALADGENVIGRDPSSAMWLDSARISRRHARVMVRNGEAVLEDLGSKNGTWLGEARITAAVPLAHGDHIRVGPFSLEVRVHRPGGATETEGP